VELSVAIVNWNTKELLCQCLRSVTETCQALAYEIIVVDNASSDGSPEMVRQAFPSVKLIQNQANAGFAKANNQALRQSRGKYILLLNSDAQLTPHTAQMILAAMAANPKAGIAGANLVFPDGRQQPSFSPLPSLRREYASLLGLDKLWQAQVPECPFLLTGYVSGACLMFRWECMQQIGLLDEGFFMFGEEVDLCLRAHKMGWEVIHIPEATVIHLEAGSTGRTPERMLKLYRGKTQYFRKHFGASTAQRYLTAASWVTAGKVMAYTLVRLLSLGKIQKDHFWRKVSQGLPDLHVE
jgi:GT2 family glycosyltransferase